DSPGGASDAQKQ
nr:RecName: Full=Hemocyanin subunit 1 [Liocarcinus depurator]